MPWIETVPYEDAEGRLKQLYDRVKGPDDNVDNIMMMHRIKGALDPNNRLNPSKVLPDSQ